MATVMRIAKFVFGLGLGGVVACGGGPGPTSTLDKYSRALADHDFGGAYELMSDAFKARVSREDYVQMMRDNPSDVRATADALAGRRNVVEVTAELSYGFGDSLRLVQEGGSWRLAENPIAFYDQSTPRATLLSFLRAYRLERWDVMLRYVPSRYRAKMDVDKMKAQFNGPSKAQMDLLMTAMEANAEAPIAERGSAARMAYGGRYEVKFVREDDAWMIEDPD